MRSRLAFILAAVVGVGLSCQERLAPGETSEGWKICTFVNAAKVYDDQGQPVGVVHGPGGGNSAVCVCLTEDEYWSGELDDYFNDQALATCIEDATRMGYPDAHDCEFWHDEGQWIDMIQPDPFQADKSCDPDGPGEPIGGCSVR